MSFRAIFAAGGNPFPVGGRIAAQADLHESGIEPLTLPLLGRRQTGRQPANRGLDQVAIILARPTFGRRAR